MTTTTRAPAGLADPGRRFWRAIVSAYDLRLDELRLLDAACRCLDELAAIDHELRTAPVTVPGSNGQPRPNPLLNEARKHRALFAALCRQLDLDHLDETTVDDETAAQRRSAAGRALVAQRRDRQR